MVNELSVFEPPKLYCTDMKYVYQFKSLSNKCCSKQIIKREWVQFQGEATLKFSFLQLASRDIDSNTSLRANCFHIQRRLRIDVQGIKILKLTKMPIINQVEKNGGIPMFQNSGIVLCDLCSKSCYFELPSD